MKYLVLRFVPIVFVALLVQVDYLHATAQTAKAQGHGSKAISRDGTPSYLAPSSSTPLSAQQKAPEPVVVRYQDGELTIESFDAPLSDILRAVYQRTAVLIHMPTQAADEHITINTGPGPAINVLGSLLSESSFNYMIEELGSNQGAPVRVTLFLKNSSSHGLQPNEDQDQTVAIAGETGLSALEVSQKVTEERGELVRQIVSYRRSLLNR
jgi:hypothetical protein